MKNKFKINIIAASTTTLLCSASWAETDLSVGSFIYSNKTSSLDMIYNSRSLGQGLLGFGWCTPLQDSLDILSATTLRIRKCRAGKIVTYKSDSQDLRSPSSLEKSFSSGDEKIVAADSKYLLTTNGSELQTFDKTGKLIEVKDERGKTAKLIYDKNGFLKEVVSGRKDSLQLKVDPRSGRLIELVDSAVDHQGARTRLTFSKGSLISISGPRKAQYFNYDSFGNLTQVTKSNKTIAITYDSQDRVISVKTSPDCRETYSYIRSESKNQTEVTTNCRGINNKRLVDFFYTKNLRGETSLNNVSIQDLQLRSTRLPATNRVGLQ